MKSFVARSLILLEDLICIAPTISWYSLRKVDYIRSVEQLDRVNAA